MEPSAPEETQLRRFLAAAEDQPMEAGALAAGWRMARIELIAAGAGAITRNPNAPAKLRGAWGRALAEEASKEAVEGKPCPWPAPCAYDVFFNNQGRVTSRLEIPKPFVISLEPVEDTRDLRIVLTLFGIATDWAGEASCALIRAARSGLDGAEGRRPLEIISRDVALTEGAPLADLSAGAILRFESPVSLRQGGQHHVTPGSMITSLANRINGLARWQGARLSLDPEALKAEAEALGARAEWRDAETSSWRRQSRAQGRRTQFEGVTGDLLLPAPGPGVTALLSIGEWTHLGSRAALGMGRYHLLGFAEEGF